MWSTHDIITATIPTTTAIATTTFVPTNHENHFLKFSLNLTKNVGSE